MSAHHRADVVILGGGMSGLAAADTLRDHDVIVIEKEPSVGGRMHSERLDGRGPWGNYGAQMITAERVTVVRLARQAGCVLIPVKWAHVLERARLTFQGMRVEQAAQDELRQTIARLEAEQAVPRDPKLPELDEQSFGHWLGEVHDSVREFWEDWSQGLADASIDAISLYAALCLWGDQRVSPWTGDHVPFHDLGDCIVEGGTGEIGRALGEHLPGVFLTGTEVLECVPDQGGYLIRAHDGDGSVEIHANQVVSALPAPVVLAIGTWLPEWKRSVLASVRYGRFLVTPIWVSPANERCTWQSAEGYRAGQIYTPPAFPLRTPGDVDTEGACYQSWVNDRDAGGIWDDSDDSIRTGVRAAFLKRFPEYEDRIQMIGVKRWQYGLPTMSPGRMGVMDQLIAPVDGMHFCGDYTGVANLEGAAVSGIRAAQGVSASSRLDI